MLAMLNTLCSAVMNKLHALTRNIDIIYKTYTVYLIGLVNNFLYLSYQLSHLKVIWVSGSFSARLVTWCTVLQVKP